MITIPRDVAQTLIEKLDRGFMRPSEVKQHVWHTYGVALTGRTSGQIVSAIGKNMAKETA